MTVQAKDRVMIVVLFMILPILVLFMYELNEAIRYNNECTQLNGVVVRAYPHGYVCLKLTAVTNI